MCEESKKSVQETGNRDKLPDDWVKREVVDIRRKMKALQRRLERLESKASEPQAA